MDKNLEKQLNTTAYVLIIIIELIYIYVTQNDENLSDEDKNELVKLGRTISLITGIYFVINAYIGFKIERNKGQIKQLIAASFTLIAALIRLSIKDDDITFR